MPDKAVVIFGASGFIGFNLHLHFKEKIKNIYLVSSSTRVLNDAKFISFDELDQISLPQDTVAINVAACRYNASKHHSFKSHICLENTKMYSQFFDWCVRKNINEVRFASSIAVYTGSKTLLDDTVDIDYSLLPSKTESLYGTSKRIAEILAKAYHEEYGINSLMFRFSNPYGPYDCQDYTKAHVLPALIMKALNSKTQLQVLGNMQASRDFIFIDDICNIFEKSLSMTNVNDSFNVATGSNITIEDLAKLIIRYTNNNLSILNEGNATSSVVERFCKVEKLKKLLNIKEFTSLETGLRKTIEWYKNVKN